MYLGSKLIARLSFVIRLVDQVGRYAPLAQRTQPAQPLHHVTGGQDRQATICSMPRASQEIMSTSCEQPFGIVNILVVRGKERER